MRVALYTGSFDPITNGHIEVARAAACICDELIIAIGIHPGKTPIFSAEERAALIQQTVGDRIDTHATKLSVQTFSGLAIVAAQACGAQLLIRGLRDGSDFDYEMQIFLPASPAVRHITATLVRQIASLGGDISPFVPQSVATALQVKFKKI
jgi:pantetheine-phosphate adenylyltransferase